MGWSSRGEGAGGGVQEAGQEAEVAGVTMDTPSTAREVSVTPRKSVLTWGVVGRGRA